MSLGAIGAGTKIAGSLFDAYSQYAAYKEQKATTKYNKAIIDSNTRIDNALTDLDIRSMREEGEELLGTQRAAIGKSGSKFSGSNLTVFMDTLKDIEMDVMTVELGKMIRGAQATQQKGMLDVDLGKSKAAMTLKIASSLLGGAGSVASSQSTNIAQSAAGS